MTTEPDESERPFEFTPLEDDLRQAEIDGTLDEEYAGETKRARIHGIRSADGEDPRV